MKNDNYAKALTEVYIVLQNSDKELQNMIPEKFQKFITENMENEYVPEIDFNDENWDDHILTETQAILAMIYRDYIASKEEREQILEDELREEARIETELREKYNPDNIFKKEKCIKENTDVVQETSLIIVEEKWYKKIFNIIKKYMKNFNKKEEK